MVASIVLAAVIAAVTVAGRHDLRRVRRRHHRRRLEALLTWDAADPDSTIDVPDVVREHAAGRPVLVLQPGCRPCDDLVEQVVRDRPPVAVVVTSSIFGNAMARLAEAGISALELPEAAQWASPPYLLLPAEPDQPMARMALSSSDNLSALVAAGVGS